MRVFAEYAAAAKTRENGRCQPPKRRCRAPLATAGRAYARTPLLLMMQRRYDARGTHASAQRAAQHMRAERPLRARCARCLPPRQTPRQICQRVQPRRRVLRDAASGRRPPAPPTTSTAYAVHPSRHIHACLFAMPPSPAMIRASAQRDEKKKPTISVTLTARREIVLPRAIIDVARSPPAPLMFQRRLRTVREDAKHANDDARRHTTCLRRCRIRDITSISPRALLARRGGASSACKQAHDGA